MSLRILLAIDQSEHAKAASSVALDLLGRIPDAELIALHVVDVVPPSGNVLKDLPGRLGFEPAVVSEAVLEQHDEAGRRVLGQLKVDAETAGLEIKTVLEHGAVVERIDHYASHVDLLIVGTRGVTEERFPGQGGGHIFDMITKVEIPILLVPIDAERIERITIGYDESEASSRAVGALRQLVAHVKFDVEVVWVDTGKGKGKPDLAVVDADLPEVTVKPHVVKAASVREGLAAVATESQSNLLVLGFSGKSKLKDFLFGSASEYLLTDQRLMILLAH